MADRDELGQIRGALGELASRIERLEQTSGDARGARPAGDLSRDDLTAPQQAAVDALRERQMQGVYERTQSSYVQIQEQLNELNMRHQSEPASPEPVHNQIDERILDLISGVNNIPTSVLTRDRNEQMKDAKVRIENISGIRTKVGAQGSGAG